MLTRVIDRVRACDAIDDIVVATTTEPSDDELLPIAKRAGATWWRGSSRDVLHRYVEAARSAQADVVVRITADCPLIDPGVLSRVVNALDESDPCDYASNVIVRTFPRGLDAEVFHMDCLLRVHRLARSPGSREHVTSYVYVDRPDLFVLRSVEDPNDNSDLSWAVDTEADLALVRRLYADLGLSERLLDYREVLQRVRSDKAATDAEASQRPAS